MAPSGRTYKIKLASGRVLGPLDLDRVQKLIRKKQIIGTEVARVYPDGEWQDINLIAEIAELLVAKAAGELTRVKSDKASAPAQAGTLVLPGATVVLPGTSAVGASELKSISEIQTATEESGEGPPSVPIAPRVDESAPSPRMGIQRTEEDQRAEEEDDEPTNVAPLEEEPFDRTKLSDAKELALISRKSEIQAMEEEEPARFRSVPISQERTVVFQRSSGSPGFPSRSMERMSTWEKFKAVLAAVALGMVLYEVFLAGPSIPPLIKIAPIRPTLPSHVQGPSDPEKSIRIYNEAMRHYLADNTVGYRFAAEKFREAAGYDSNNVKALALLASSYLNLIDSSNKDENYFAVISKLIDMSRAKALDIPETVIADVEFYLTANKAEAAENRIVEYTKSHPTFDIVLFYYLAVTFYHRGDAEKAARYLSQLPDAKAFSPKIFYLRGLISEKLNDSEAALAEYNKAIKFNVQHAKSRLRIADIYFRQNRLKDATSHLEFLTTNQRLLPPKELGLAFFLHSKLEQVLEKYDLALGDIERAVKLDKDNHDYLLELYTLRAKAGDNIKSIRKVARMYYFLSEGEKLLRDGNHNEALKQFLQARQSNDASPLPLIRIGDMFRYLNDLGNAKENYKMAADRAPNSIEIWSKYIDVLIQSYEWEDAAKAMDKFRNLPVPQSAIDKAAADMYEKQGRHLEAQAYYRKAMARDSIDPGVYIAYAKSLMSTKNFKEAPFFFALALRFDPLNVEALVGTAKCIAATESIDRAINMLQDELQKGTGARAELLAGIAELQIQKGAWDQAQINVDAAIAANPNFAFPWKLQAQIHQNKEGVERDALDKTLSAYKSYSDRNSSDPSGYIERYRIFIKKGKYEEAAQELEEVYKRYQKYPNLHYYKGALYTVQGNTKAAIAEFNAEIKNNPSNTLAFIALGKVEIEAGAPSDALNHFNRAMQLAPQSAEAKQQSAYANYLLKNYQGAVALYLAALEIDKANPMIYKRLGLAYRDMGDAEGSVRAFQKYLEMEPDAIDRQEVESLIRNSR